MLHATCHDRHRRKSPVARRLRRINPHDAQRPAYTSITAAAIRRTRPTPPMQREDDMKGMDQKKNTKKAPTKTLKEKRAAKQEKKK